MTAYGDSNLQRCSFNALDVFLNYNSQFVMSIFNTFVCAEISQDLEEGFFTSYTYNE